MKDKTHSMNSGYNAGSGAEKGYKKLPDGEIATTWDRKKRQLDWANLEDNNALLNYENVRERDEDTHQGGGFLPRNNYEDRY